jgi:hypothetical protein
MPTTNDAQALRDASLQDTLVSEQLTDMRARSSRACDAEWGMRDEDFALVLHFFPPGYAADDATTWPNWHAFRDALETGIIACFENFEAGYAEELKSFYLILKPRPQVPDLNGLIERFFYVLEGALKTA